MDRPVYLELQFLPLKNVASPPCLAGYCNLGAKVSMVTGTNLFAVVVGTRSHASLLSQEREFFCLSPSQDETVVRDSVSVVTVGSFYYSTVTSLVFSYYLPV